MNMTSELVIGLDSGCSSVKIVGAKGELSFPTHTIEKGERPSLGGMFAFKNAFEMTLNEITYLLGEHASKEDPANEENIDELRAGTKNNDGAFVRSIGGICRYLDKKNLLNKIEEDVYVYMTYGNPLRRAMDEKDVKEITERFLNDGEPHEVEYNGISLNIYIKDIIVLPEGIAAGFSKLFPYELVQVADAGSQTMNLTQLQDGDPFLKRSKTINRGVELAKATHGDGAAANLAKRIQKEATDLDWEEGTDIWVCGGFAEQIYAEFEKLPNKKYNMRLIQPTIQSGTRKTPKIIDPIYANATGMYVLATELFTATVKG